MVSLRWRDFPALWPMVPRHAVLLTEHAAKHAHPERVLCGGRAEGSLLAASPSNPAAPAPLLSRQHLASLTPLDATLMNLPASVANKRLTAGLTPLDATLTKNMGGTCLFHPTFKTFQPSNVSTVFGLSRFFSCNSTLFCTIQNRILFLFNQIRTLLQKHPGGGYPPRLAEEEAPC
jgi:hypothetical protein